MSSNPVSFAKAWASRQRRHTARQAIRNPRIAWDIDGQPTIDFDIPNEDTKSMLLNDEYLKSQRKTQRGCSTARDPKPRRWYLRNRRLHARIIERNRMTDNTSVL